MENNLPKGWREALLENVADARMGETILAKDLTKSGIPVYSAGQDNAPWGFLEKPKKIHSKGTIVVSARGSIGFPKIPDNDHFASTQTTIALKLRDENLTSFCCLWLKTINWDELTKGGAIPMLTVGDINKLVMPLPPEKERERILSKLKALLPKVKDAQSRLDKIPTILGRFRQSVFAAAFSGELTKEWRAKNSSYIANDDLNFIKDFILKSKITNREKKVFEEINKACLDPYKEQFVVPLSWKAYCIGMVGLVNNGSTPSRKIAGYWNGSIPWISSGEVRNNIISESREKITQKGLDDCSSKLFPSGTVLIAMIGEGKTRGQSAILNIDAAINQNIAAIQISHGRVNPEYLWFWFQFQYENNRNYGSGSGPQALNCQRVRELPFVLAPKAEQDEIVKKIKLSFDEIDGFIDRYRKANDYTDKLEQSILAKAFRGELVFRDPNGKPVAELLKKIVDKKHLT